MPSAVVCEPANTDQLRPVRHEEHFLSDGRQPLTDIPGAMELLVAGGRGLCSDVCVHTFMYIYMLQDPNWAARTHPN